MLRVVADTNIIISGLFFDKRPQRLLQLAIDGKIKLILPDLIIKEVNDKISEKFGEHENLDTAKDFWFVLQRAFAETKEDSLSEESTSVDCADSDDKAIIEHTAMILPNYFISGDTDVLTIENKPFPIVKLVDFLKTEFPSESEPGS